MFCKSLAPFCLSLLLASLPAGAQQTGSDEAPPTMAEIEQAWQRGDTVVVREGLARLATETGTALAQYRYGRVLAEGLGGPRDLSAAIDWLQKAVDQNHAEAATLLARILLAGGADGDSRDAPRAAALLARSATRGDAEAQYLLARQLRVGDGVAADPEAAYNWLLAAAEQRHAEAQYLLAQAYDRGEGTEASPAEALRWLTGAAEAGHVLAQYVLGERLSSGPAETRDPAAALRWYRSAAEAGLPIAQRALGTLYLSGEGIPADAAEAERWLSAAAGAGDPGAMYNLALAHLAGDLLRQDDARARNWLERAVDADLPRAATTLASMLELGRGGEADPDRAVALYRAAAEAGQAPAMLRLAELAVDGALDGRLAPQRAVNWVLAAARQDRPGARDWLAARAEEGMRAAQLAYGELLLESSEEAGQGIVLITRAAKAGDVRARALLGEAYATGGNGLEQDYVAAHGWYNLAAAGGAPEAEDRRDVIAQLMTPEQVAAAQAMARAIHEAEPTPPFAGQTSREGQ